MRHQAWLDKHLQSLNGKTVVVTGASHGLGFFTSMQLAYKGAHVIMASRNKERNDVAMQRILDQVPHANLTYVQYDQSSFSSIQDFVKRMKQTHPIVDILVLNAGIIMPPKDEVTPEGFPLTTGVNFINVYYLLREWLGFLDQRNKEVRVVFVGSFSSYKARLSSYKELLNPRLTRMQQYGKSKLALAMLHHVLQMNLNLFDFPVLDHIHALLVHPGLATSNISHRLPTWLHRTVQFFIGLISHSAEAGALSISYASAHPYTVNGSFYGPNGPGEMSGYPKKLTLKKHFSKGSAQLTYDLGKFLQKEFQ